MEKELAELDQKAQEPGFWDDAENSQKVLQKSKAIRDKLELLNRLVNDPDLVTLLDLGWKKGRNDF